MEQKVIIRLFNIVVAITVLVFAFQNCDTNKFFKGKDVGATPYKSMYTGNGQGYDGKMTDTFHLLEQDFICGDENTKMQKESIVIMSMEADADRNSIDSQCGVSTSTIQLLDVEIPPYNDRLVIYRDKIYEKKKLGLTVQDMLLNPIEAWCTGDSVIGQAIDITVQYVDENTSMIDVNIGIEPRNIDNIIVLDTLGYDAFEVPRLNKMAYNIMSYTTDVLVLDIKVSTLTNSESSGSATIMINNNPMSFKNLRCFVGNTIK